jgi:hypothetical protein
MGNNEWLWENRYMYLLGELENRILGGILFRPSYDQSTPITDLKVGMCWDPGL